MSSAVACQMGTKDVNRLYKHLRINIELNKAMSQICSNTADVFPTYHPGGGDVLPILAYTGRLRPKGVPFSGFRYIKG